MDIEKMRERLERFVDLSLKCREASAGLNGWNDVAARLDAEATVEIPTVTKIIKALDPSFSGQLMPPSYAGLNGDSVRQAREALGILRDREEWPTLLAPDAPSLQADQFHHLIWQAASTIWPTGQYKTAVQQTTVALSAHVKSKAESHLNERKLVQQVFSADPPKFDQPRLHLPGDPKDDTWQSRQQGLHLLAQGAFAGIRNVAAHDDEPWAEHEALEHLAVLSVVARWADETSLVTV